MNEIMAIGLLAIGIGVSGWLVPYRYNVLRLRSFFASALSQEANERVPKIVGSLLIAAGILVVLGSFLGIGGPPGDGVVTPADQATEQRATPIAEAVAKEERSEPAMEPAQATSQGKIAGSSANPENDEAVNDPDPDLEVDARLLELVAGRDAEAIRRALAAGANPDARNEDGWTALLLAVDYESTIAIDELLAAGADPDLPVTGPYGGTPLFYAVLTGNLGIVQRLVEAGADLETRSDIDQMTPLLTALYSGDREIARYLVARGADTEARDRHDTGADGYLGETTLEEFLAGN
ncbi:MAG: ankyrin repeat domain-containing protein [Thermoanaerobaculia bacterium]|nr:ankyrin repeat domain-containing protein [Thermoanaerobaculia bacterium]